MSTYYTEEDFCANENCVPFNVLFSNNGIPAPVQDYVNAKGMLPVTLVNGDFLSWFVFYINFMIISRLVAYFLYRDSKKKQKIVGAFFPSWVHALLSVLLSYNAVQTAAGNNPSGDITLWFAMMHSFGYFIADCIMDRDLAFFSHHLGPIIFAEIMVRIGGSFYHSVWFGFWCELGNVLGHFVAMCTGAEGKLYCRSLALFYLVTRVASMVSAIQVIFCDLPVAYRFGGGCAVSLAIIMVYGSNLWVFKRLLGGAGITVAASVQAPGGAKVGSACSAKFGRGFAFVLAALGKEKIAVGTSDAAIEETELDVGPRFFLAKTSS